MKKAFGILVILFCLLASGCSILKLFENSPEPAPIVTKEIKVPMESLFPCPLIPLLDSNATFEGTIKPGYLDLIGLYGECSLKQDNSIKIIKELSGVGK